MANYKKIDDNTIEVTIQPPLPAIIVNTYDYDFLLLQREAIKKQAQEFADARKAELDEIETYIAECNKLGIKSKTK